MSLPIDFPMEPKALWQRFYEITQIPRPSKKEIKIIEYLVESAKKANLDYSIDQAQNVVIYVPGSEGYVDHPTVILQGHMDMVCEKTEDKVFDFEQDSIDLKVKKGWIHAEGTTLGADNGLGCAAALAIIDESNNIAHPPLELLFTVDEETGLHGALNLDPSMLKGSKIINLDSADWGEICIGCAGGVTYHLTKSFSLKESSKELVPFKLEVTGLKGGHSGGDIHLGLGNSIKILSELLWELSEKKFNYSISEIRGGTAHNVIPRNVFASIQVCEKDVQTMLDYFERKQRQLQAYLPKEDSGLEINFTKMQELSAKSLEIKDQDNLLALLNFFPHGAVRYNLELNHSVVANSNNMAVCNFVDGKLFVETSLRYFDRNASLELEQKLQGIAKIFDLNLKNLSDYPSWIPDFSGELLGIAKQELNKFLDEGKEPKVMAIHAGLECGILKSKVGDHLDAISIGPNIRSMHSPSECLEIESSRKFWSLLVNILEKL